MTAEWRAFEPAWRLGVFATVLVAMIIAEAIAPRRRRSRPRRGRWASNLSMTVVDAVVVRIAAPAGLTGLAIHATQHGWGLLPRVVAHPFARGLTAFVALDLLVYAQHVAFHHVPVLWRMHRVHHCDEDIDTTTGVRFHPLEILLSLGLKAATIVALGVPPLAVLVFEIVLNGSALFNHANWRLPLRLDCLMRLLIVTPDMHRVHHSTRVEEQNANFGFNLPWWDRVFGTYRADPSAGHDRMAIGVAGLPDPGSLTRLLALPLRRS